MPISTLAFVKERARQRVMDDENFLKRLLYFFEMRVPHEVATVGGFLGFLFPLILPPESYSMSEPFTVEATPTQGGGLYVEENGIVQRTIRITGNTGFKPRSLKLRLGDAYPAILDSSQKSYSRELPELILTKISGHRHFQYLQDSVFRTYGDLKRDPTTAKDTQLIFHNPKDQEHWLVVPKKFDLNRTSAKPLIYQYTIELLVVDKAEATRADFSEDKGIFETLRDGLRTLKKAIDMVAGAVNDLTALLGDIKSFVNDIANILDSVAGILDSVTDFVNGLTEFVQLPYTFLESAIDMVESAQAIANAWEELEDAAAGSEDSTGKRFPRPTKQKLAILQDGLELMGAFPAVWEAPTETIMREIRDEQESRRGISDDRRQEALDFGSPSSFTAVNELGTRLTAGDAVSADGEITTGSAIKQYKNAREVIIEQGDTLVTLAARYLGDARQWQRIAILNNLKPPFVDDQASAPLVSGVGVGSTTTGAATGADESPFSRTLGIGSRVLVPTNLKSSLDLPVLPVLGVKSEESAEKQFLGTDLLLEPTNGPYGSNRTLYDIPIDTELGSVDAKLISGVNNLKQVITIRLLTDKGTDTLYKTLGVQRIVGLNSIPLDLEMARFRMLEAIDSDPRVSSVRNLKFEEGEDDDPVKADRFQVDMVVGIRGFAQSRAVRTSF